MPGKNIIKSYVKDGHYHIYNRGVEKRIIFLETQDFKVFLKYLKEYLSPPPKPINLKKSITFNDNTFRGIPRQPKNYHKEIVLIAYCLMPNHFHLLIKQKSKTSIEKFMRSFATRYSMFFNKKYNRVGKLFQGHYKASLITKEDYLLHLTRYIHQNPLEYTKDLTKAHSSYADYLGLRETKWINPKPILAFFNNKVRPEFKKINSYKDFIENYKKDSAEALGQLTLE